MANNIAGGNSNQRVLLLVGLEKTDLGYFGHGDFWQTSRFDNFLEGVDDGLQMVFIKTPLTGPNTLYRAAMRFIVPGRYRESELHMEAFYEGAMHGMKEQLVANAFSGTNCSLKDVTQVLHYVDETDPELAREHMRWLIDMLPTEARANMRRVERSEVYAA